MKENSTTKKTNNIKNFPLDKFNNDWPFDEDLLVGLFSKNSYYLYDSLIDFLVQEKYDFNEDFIYGIFIEENIIYYRDSDSKVYTLENIPYPFLFYNAINYHSKHYSRSINSLFNWSKVLNYLMFTPIFVRKIVEEGAFIKSDKKNIIYGFLHGFYILDRNADYDFRVKKFFLNHQIDNTFSVKTTSDSWINSYLIKESPKEKLYNTLILSEIPENEAKVLTEITFLSKSFNNIIRHYEDILKKL